MSGNGGSAVGLLSYETLVHAVAGAMVSADTCGLKFAVVLGLASSMLAALVLKKKRSYET